jgi:hypothetical protein
VPVAATKVSLAALNELPFHHLDVLVFSIATTTLTTVVPVPELDEAVPVIFPVQLPP